MLASVTSAASSSPERDCRQALLAQHRACERSHHRADSLTLLEIGETRDAAEAGAQRDRNAAHLVWLGKPHMTLARAFLIHDRIEDDIAIDTAQLHGKNHPADLELDAELVGQRLAELELEAAAIAGLAGERQRIGIGTDQEDAAAPDRIERTGTRSAGQRQAGQNCRHDEALGEHSNTFKERHDRASGSRLEIANIRDDRLDVVDPGSY